MKRLLILLLIAAAGCDRPPAPEPAPAPVVTLTPATAAAASTPVAVRGRTAEELKEQFSRHFLARDTKGTWRLYYSEGAGQRALDLYRGGDYLREDETVASIEIVDITKDRRPSVEHTLKPEKVLLIKYGPTPDGTPSISIEMYRFIGFKDGVAYLTMPK